MVKPESRKNVEKKVKNVKNDEKMSKKRLISVLNEGKNSVKSNKYLNYITNKQLALKVYKFTASQN